MRTRHRTILLPAIAMCGLALSTVAAGPPPTEWIDPDAKWVGHLDVTAAVNSKFGHFLLETPELDLDIHEPFEEFKAHTGMDPLKEIRQITVYGSDFDEGPDVLIAIATEAVDGVIERMKTEDPGYNAMRLGDYDVHSWGDGEGYAHVRPHAGARLLVASPSSERLEKALRVIDGTSPSMKTVEPRVITEELKPGTFLFVFWTNLDWIQHDEMVGDVMKHAGGTHLQIGEVDGVTFAEAGIAAESDETARDIVEVGQGLLAVGRIVSRGKPEMRHLAELSSGVRIEAHGRRIIAAIKFDIEQLMMQERGDGTP